MTSNPSNRIAFFKGKITPLEEAKVSITTHALHYGTGIFEGIRGNWNEKHKTIYIFRLKEHLQRLLQGSRILMIDLPYSLDELCHIVSDLVWKSGYKEDLYIRPLAYKSAEKIANLKLHELESDFCVMAMPFGNYLETDALRCCTSSWRRPDDQSISPRFKFTGIYINSILAKTEAVLSGFDEAIVMNQQGYVSEGTGENIFVIKDGEIRTPPLTDNVLPGITRDTIIQLAEEELGLKVKEDHISRPELYVVDEVFLTGTAAHLSPVVELDNRKIGNGNIGPISKALRDLYFDVATGNNPKYLHWCTAVSAPK